MNALEKKPIADANDSELRSFATDYLQLEIDGAKVNTRAKILAEINKAWTADFIMVPEAAATLPELGEVAEQQGRSPETPAHDLTSNYKDDPVVVLTIMTAAGLGGKYPASCSVNGVQLVIPRDVKWNIPYRFYLALCEAHEIEVRQDEKTLEYIQTKISNYPLNVERLPSKEEIADFHARTDDKVLA